MSRQPEGKLNGPGDRIGRKASGVYHIVTGVESHCRVREEDGKTWGLAGSDFLW